MKGRHLWVAIILVGCSMTNPRVVTTLNSAAALTATETGDPLHWRVITSGVRPRNSTMFTLFGNDAAIQYSRTNAAHDYPTGSALALVTWRQQEDSRWFGARIPSQVKSVEVVEVRTSGSGQSVNTYRVWEGTPLQETTSLKGQGDSRASYLVSLRAAVMP
jgi:hypothetical protein